MKTGHNAKATNAKPPLRTASSVKAKTKPAPKTSAKTKPAPKTSAKTKPAKTKRQLPSERLGVPATTPDVDIKLDRISAIMKKKSQKSPFWDDDDDAQEPAPVQSLPAPGSNGTSASDDTSLAPPGPRELKNPQPVAGYFNVTTRAGSHVVIVDVADKTSHDLQVYARDLRTTMTVKRSDLIPADVVDAIVDQLRKLKS
jgi:hypothetical protein